jgi:uncharacterized protein (TIGR03032 family)
MQAPIFKSSKGFVNWLASTGGTLLITARQHGKIYTIGTNKNGEITISERRFPQPRGLYVHGKSLFMADHFRVWRFENALRTIKEHPFKDHDAVYIPEMMYRTGNHDCHDIGLLKNGMVVFASTRMNCIGGCTATHGMVPLWKPPFIKDIVYNDHCHINGLALKEGVLKYVTAVSTTDSHEGWRDVRATGGVLMDVNKNTIIASGLSMPHSPRIHDGKIWIANAGTGEVGTVNPETGSFTPKTFVNGFVRGLVFVGEHGITSTTKLRRSKSFQGLPIEEKLKDSGQSDICGLHIFNLETGNVDHCLEVSTPIDVIYDVTFLAGFKNILLGGLDDDLSANLITLATHFKS